MYHLNVLIFRSCFYGDFCVNKVIIYLREKRMTFLNAKRPVFRVYEVVVLDQNDQL